MYNLSDDPDKRISSNTPPKEVLTQIQRIEQIMNRWLKCNIIMHTLEEEHIVISKEIAELMHELGVTHYCSSNGAMVNMVEDYEFNLDDLYKVMGTELWKYIAVNKSAIASLAKNAPMVAACIKDKKGEYVIKLWPPNKEQ